MYNMGRQSERRRAAEAKKGYPGLDMLSAWRQKECQEKHTSGNHLAKEAGDVKGRDGTRPC